MPKNAKFLAKFVVYFRKIFDNYNVSIEFSTQSQEFKEVFMTYRYPKCCHME